MKLTDSGLNKAVSLLKEAHRNDEDSKEFVEDKVRFLLEDGINNPTYLILVNKDITAILIWHISSTYFSYKKMINEVVFYSRTAGSGFRLLKESESWLEGWGGSVERVCLSTTSNNEKVDKMIERFGYKKVGSQFIKGDKKWQ